jgi:hypothetical protein
VFGPATVGDLKWWTGWTLGDTRKALAALDLDDVDLPGSDGQYTRGVVLAEDVEPIEPPEPWVALLPALDSTPMGWAEREWYLGAHGSQLFDRSGNVGPTVWVDGRVVGGWGQRRDDGRIVVRLLEDVDAAPSAAVDAEAERLTAWLDGQRFTNRFPTPLQKEIAGG